LATTEVAADAQELNVKLRQQDGYTAIRTSVQGGDTDDLFASLTPELSLTFPQRLSQIDLTYAFTGTLHTQLPNEVSNRLALTSFFEVSPTTQLLLNAEALQTSIGNYLVVKGTRDTSVNALPALNTQLLTLTTSQGISHEITPVVRLTEGITGSYVHSLDPDIRTENYLTTADVAVDRSWRLDAIGLELKGQFAHTIVPPINQKVVTVGLGPRWVHDWSRTISTSAQAGVAVAISPDGGTKPLVVPAGRATALYVDEGSGAELSYIGGFEPNLITGALLRSHLGTLRGFTPLWEAERILGTTSVGYLHASTIDLRTSGALDVDVDTILADADISWQATGHIAVFVRYQLIDQLKGDGPAATPALIRHAALVGIQLASRPADRRTVPTKFPQRVDQSDKPASLSDKEPK
jgi:hypothetical protein